VKPDYSRRFHCFIEVAIDGILHHSSQFFDAVALSVDALT
jgi:hypothetical protein